MLKQLIEKQDGVTCKVCGKDGERLTFTDTTTQVQHVNSTPYKTVHING